MKDSEFYSNQPWYVKLWRNKTLFFIPFHAINTWIKQLSHVPADKYDLPMSWRNCLSIARGMADVRRKHLIRYKEIKDRDNEQAN